jgi:hypothetical protein
MGMREKLMDVVCESIATDRCIAYCNYPHCGLVQTVVRNLIDNGVTIPVRCKDCKYWLHMEDGFGDCTNSRFHLDNHADPTMKADDFCSCGERRIDD